jgi:tetratricopeptide (TPR) repeat protein
MHAWSPIRLALRTFLLDQAGVLSVESRALKDAIRSRYGSNAEIIAADRKLIADHFLLSATESRSVDELVFLLPAIADWKLAAGLICHESWLASARERDPAALAAFFSSVLAASADEENRIIGFLEDTVRTSAIESAALAATELLIGAGQPLRAARAARDASRSNPAPQTALKLRELAAESSARAGNLDEALEALSGLREEVVSEPMSSRIRERAGLLALDMGQIDIAERLFEELRKGIVDREGHRRMRCHLAAVALRRGKAKVALEAFSALTSEAKREKDLDTLCAALGGKGLSLRELGSIKQASIVHLEEEALWRRRGDRIGLSKCLLNQAFCRIENDDFDGGSELLTQAFTHAREGGDRYLAANILDKQIDILQALGLGSGQIADGLRTTLAQLTKDAEGFRPAHAHIGAQEPPPFGPSLRAF